MAPDEQLLSRQELREEVARLKAELAELEKENRRLVPELAAAVTARDMNHEQWKLVNQEWVHAKAELARSIGEVMALREKLSEELRAAGDENAALKAQLTSTENSLEAARRAREIEVAQLKEELAEEKRQHQILKDYIQDVLRARREASLEK